MEAQHVRTNDSYVFIIIYIVFLLGMNVHFWYLVKNKTKKNINIESKCKVLPNNKYMV